MASRSREVPYGRPSFESAGPAVRVESGVPLRLCHGPYDFAEPPDLVRAVTVAERMQLLRETAAALCRPWDKGARLFLEAYFAAVARAIEAARDELRALSARAGGLFAPEDWSFMALRPLPQAHLAADPPVRAELAFWTDGGFVAVTIEGGASLTRAEREMLARLEAAGATLARIPARALAGGEDVLPFLPPGFQRFWEGVALPSSPFGPEALGEL